MFSNFWYQISLCPRVLVKMSVVLLCSMIGMSLCARFKPRWPAQGSVSISSGMIEIISVFFFSLVKTSVLFSVFGTSTSSASSIFPIVADMPQSLTAGCNPLSLEIASSVITPRLEPSNSCHSSTATHFKLAKCTW